MSNMGVDSINVMSVENAGTWKVVFSGRVGIETLTVNVEITNVSTTV